VAGDEAPVDQECVEGYLFVRRPPKFLLLRRPPARGSIWVPLSGKVEPTDPTFEAALLRELEEETGFRPVVDPVPLDWHVRFPGPDGRRWRLHAWALERLEADPPRLSAEHDAFEWVAFDEAMRRLHYSDNRDALRRLVERAGLDLRAGSRRPGRPGGNNGR